MRLTGTRRPNIFKRRKKLFLYNRAYVSYIVAFLAGSVFCSPTRLLSSIIMGVGTGGAEGAAAPPTFGTGEQAIALAPPKV